MIIRENTRETVTSSLDVVKILVAILNSEDDFEKDKEHFWVLGLNVRNHIKYVELSTLGTLTSSVVHPRETFRLAVNKGIASIIIGHNHPSGDITPSKDDIAMTKRIKESGDILGIRVLDSIIISTDCKHYSMQEAGIM